MRGVGLMAVGTAASRATGFVRTALLVAVLGLKGVSLAFNVANTAPNIVYDLLLGGILTSVVVPLLVRAEHEGHGEEYAQRLLSMTVLVLGAVSVALILLAPQIVDLYVNTKVTVQDRHLAVTFARYFLPQVLFYGAGAVLGAWLNTRGRFAAPMWAPVLNNLVVIGTLVLFALLPGPAALSSASITHTQILVLGIGTTLGVVVQTVALIPSLHATGLRLVPRLGLRGTGLGQAATLARWTFFYVLCNQLVFVVVVQLASAVHPTDRGYTAFTNAYLLWQLPHAVVAVSVITALLPAMSRAAADDRRDELRRQLDRGLRTTVTLMVPAAVLLVVLGPQVATVVFGHGLTSVPEARFVGTILAVFATGLVAFSAYQLQLRAFYAMQDTRTPAFVNLTVNAAAVVVGVAAYLALPERDRVLGLAAGQSTAYLIGLVVSTAVLGRRVPRDPDGHVLRTTARCLFGATGPALVALLVARLSERMLGHGQAGAVLGLGLGAAVLGTGYVAVVRRLRVPEVDEMLKPVLRVAQGTPLFSRTRQGG